MAETPTIWIPAGSGTVTTDNAGVVRTLTTGVTRIQQDGTTRILEDNVVFGKTPTIWSDL